METHSPEGKSCKAAGRKGGPGHCGNQPLSGKEDENQAWLAMLEKATYSVRYISRHIKKEHFIREVSKKDTGFEYLKYLYRHSNIEFK